MNKRKNQVFVWPIYTRVIHWLIASTFTLSFIFSLKKNLLNLHVAVGIIFGLMLVYRIIWGFVGPRYATFNTFELSLAKLKFYFIEKVQNRWREIPAGHNPASSWFTLIVLSLGSIISITGLLLYGIQEGKGYLGFLNCHYYMYMDILFDIHMYLSYTLLVWVIIHISGVLVEQFYHKTGMLFAMITGYKKTKGIDSKPGKYKSSLTYVFLLISAMVFYVSIDGRNNPFVVSIYDQINYEQENPAYAHKCGTCHKLYPPFMLPASSWERIQDDISNHFGEEISPDHKKEDNRISLNEQRTIFAYLKENSADHSTRKISVRVMKSLDGARGRKSITKIQYWKDAHANVPPHIFRSKEVKRKANCFACHKNFDKGMLENIDIIYYK
ncbi:MAG: cytochrome b/b6 domain-containing protein [Sulfurimonas sp.]|uniref:cytochrome b/b6 domain-containing protein n=1 Tax=Sulfurimonas sp. TaxID=2022749 RepID=UPI0025E9FD60|nr:cytochrome b/b6 domain-containing protein [Sulfurimonas sp.]MCK9492039.1 cytochrome b/b6 domain-containing protein [Sulfurimonas sp.]